MAQQYGTRDRAQISAIEPFPECDDDCETATEHAGSFADFHKLRPLQIFEAWRNLYFTVHALAATGYIHSNLSWDNIRLCHTGGNGPCSVVVDLELRTNISEPVMGTLAFMPIETLIRPIGAPIQHRKLQENEVLFWVGFLALVGCSKEGGEYITREVLKPGLPRQHIALAKLTLLSQKNRWITFDSHARDIAWAKWLTGSPEAANEWRIVRDACQKIIDVLFKGSTGVIGYPYPENEVPDFLIEHGRVTRAVAKELSGAIEKLRELKAE
jgi:hypothetical protein